MIKLKDILLETDIPSAEYSMHAMESYAKHIANAIGERIHQYLGGGANGIAYSTDSGKVLKITADFTELAAASRLKNRFRTPLPHIATPYDIRPLKGFKFRDEWNNKHITDIRDHYIILLPQVKTLEDDEKSYWGELQDYFLSDSYTDDQVRQLAETNRRHKGDMHFAQFLHKLLPQRASILRDFRKAGIRTMEAHAGNVGFDKYGRFVHYDYWVGNPDGSKWYTKLSKSKINKPIQGPKYTTDGIDTPGDPDM